MEKNGMNKEVMILIQLQTLLLKPESKFHFFFLFKKKIQKYNSNFNQLINVFIIFSR